MSEKKRVLFVGEASYIATGFGTYWNAVITRLNATGKYEIAEMGSYGSDGDPQIAQMAWKFYPVGPHQSDKAANELYKSKPSNQFGEWRFDDVCMDFKPDIVIGIRDYWMDEFMMRSSLRQYFKIIWMPTIDGEPQRTIWLDSYKRCDMVLTYSEYGMNLLKNTGNPGTNLVTIASPGADVDVFKPVADKGLHKRKLGIPPEAIIVGTVMRNQKRKLYKDLIEAFAEWIYKCKSKGHLDRVRRTFLYLHTSYPDVGYDLGDAIQDSKIGNKVLMTYLCAKCNAVFPYRFAGTTTNCLKCGQPQAHPPNASHQCPRSVLADIMNVFDLYVQYSVCEGWGMPLTEAQSCGVPTMAVDYSAMEDHNKAPTSIPIRVQRFFHEAVIETEQKRALPDNGDFVTKLDNFTKLSPSRRAEISRDTRNFIVEPVDTYGEDTQMPRRSWDRTAKIWENVIDECAINDRDDTWDNPRPRILMPQLNPPKQNMNNAEFTDWVIGTVWGRPDLVGTYFATEWVTALNVGYKIESSQRLEVNRQVVVQFFRDLMYQRNELEKRRTSAIQSQQTDQVGLMTI